MSLQLTDVHVRVPDGPDELTVLDRVDLSVGAGELTAITGDSGSGKSTLVAVAGLLRRPGQGRVSIAGHDLTGATDRQRTTVRRRQIGLVFQNPNLFPSLTAAEQLEVAAHLRGRITRSDRRRAAELLAVVGLDHRRGHRPAQLSGGERQRVALARALMGEPAVVLADEPTAALDEERGRGVMALLADLTREQQTATVVVTHAPRLLVRPDHTLHLDKGRLVPLRPTTGPAPVGAGPDHG